MANLAIQLILFREALETGRRQVEQLGKDINAKKFEERELEDKKRILLVESSYLYLKNFWSLYEFVCKKIENEDSSDLHFYIPFLRSLIELYGELMFLVNQERRTAIGFFVGNYLMYYSRNHKLISPSTILEGEFNRYREHISDVFNDEEIPLPPDIENLSQKYLKDNRLELPKYEEIFKKSFFSSVSSETFSAWENDSSDNFYNKYYRIYSSYTHRGFVNQTDANVGTEIFWMGQFMFLITQLILELSNLKIFEGSYRAEYEDFMTKSGPAYTAMQADWQVLKPTT